MDRAPLPLYRLADTVLADLGARDDLPGSVGEWMVQIRAQLKPSLDEVAKKNAGGAGDIADFVAAYGGKANFRDLLFAVHTVAHFLEWEQQPFGEFAGQRAAVALAQMIKVYLFFLECLPTIEEQQSELLDLFVERYEDADLQDLLKVPDERGSL